LLLTTLLEDHTKEILAQVSWQVLNYSRTKSVTQNIKGFIERLLRPEGRTKGAWVACRMRLWKQWLRTTALVFIWKALFPQLTVCAIE